MSTLEDLDEMDREGKDPGKQPGKDQDGDGEKNGGSDDKKDAEMKDANDGDKAEEDNVIDLEILQSSTVDIINRRRMLENELKIMTSEFQRLTHEETTMKEKIKDNTHKIENNRYVRHYWRAAYG
jgi:26S proteasome regulatory subunit T5